MFLNQVTPIAFPILAMGFGGFGFGVWPWGLGVLGLGVRVFFQVLQGVAYFYLKTINKPHIKLSG